MTKDPKFTLDIRCPWCEGIVRLAVDNSLYEPYAICDYCELAWNAAGHEVTDMGLVQGL